MYELNELPVPAPHLAATLNYDVVTGQNSELDIGAIQIRKLDRHANGVERDVAEVRAVRNQSPNLIHTFRPDADNHPQSLERFDLANLALITHACALVVDARPRYAICGPGLTSGCHAGFARTAAMIRFNTSSSVKYGDFSAGRSGSGTSSIR